MIKIKNKQLNVKKKVKIFELLFNNFFDSFLIKITNI